MQHSESTGKEHMSYKKWGSTAVSLVICMIMIIALPVIIIDPFFHFHKQLDFLQYPMDREKEYYTTDGIIRHNDFDAIITGTSMTENFKTSETDALFGTHSIKAPCAGGSLFQIDRIVNIAIDSNPKLKTVIRSVDFDWLVEGRYNEEYSETFPEYLYNSNPFDDVYYCLNKDVLLESVPEVIRYTVSGNTTPSFDEYAYWGDHYVYGKVFFNLVGSVHEENAKEAVYPTEEDYLRVLENTEKNLVDTAEANPDIEFYYFVTPYSIYYYDMLYGRGDLEKYIILHEAAIEEMLGINNIRLYSFLDLFDVITDIDNYMDLYHYSPEINSDILEYMKNGEHLITKDNFKDYCDRINDYYYSYDYNSLFTADGEIA